MKNIDDRKGYEEVKKALNVTEFTEEMQRDLFTIVASVLNLGNTGFSEVEGKASIIKSEGVEATSKVTITFSSSKNASSVNTFDVDLLKINEQPIK